MRKAGSAGDRRGRAGKLKHLKKEWDLSMTFFTFQDEFHLHF